MTTSAWPATVPQCPILNGLSEQRQPNIVSFQPDVGPPKARRRSTAVATLTNVIFRMTNDELDAFNTFYEDTLKDGSLPFTWDHPRTKDSYTWMFATDEPPSIDRMTPKTSRVTCKLLRLP